MKAALGLALLVLGGCVSQQQFNENLNSYVGRPEAELIGGLGIPDATYVSGNTKYLSYRRSATGMTAGVAPTYTSSVIGNTVFTQPVGGVAPTVYTMNCTVDFAVVNGVTRSFRYEGNSCFDY